MGCARRSYQPRHAEAGVLHGVIRDHVDDFLRAAADRADGAGLPEFIAREFRKFLTCGVLAHGFARVRSGRCALERLVPFSCKGRGFCPSCEGRRMTERAAHLVDEVIPPVPVRQWVLTLPYRLRYLLAWDHGLSRAVLAVHARALLEFYRQQAQRQGLPAGRTGTVTAVHGRVALGARAGSPVRRLGEGLRETRGGARGPRHAHLEGFDLHANVWGDPNDRARLEQVCRYVLRPPLAEKRLRRLTDGRVRLELKRPWSDGTTYLLFEPVEFLEKLAALTPRPEINLVLYHGLLAPPPARWRPDVVAYRRMERDRATDPRAGGAGARRPRYWTWALLMRRAFDLDVLRCPRCAGRMQLIATIEDPAVIQRILAQLGLPGAREDPRPPVPLTAAGAEQPALPGVTV